MHGGVLEHARVQVLTHKWACTWRPEDNLRYTPRSPSISLDLVTSFTMRADWLTREPQESICLSLPAKCQGEFPFSTLLFDLCYF